MEVTEYLVAGNSETSLLELLLLAGSQDPAVRIRVAENPNTPYFVLLRLVEDCDPEVRLAVASHPKVSVRLLEWLAEDQSVDVRFALAEDHRLPLDLLAKLQQDSNAYVVWRATSTMARINEERRAQETCQTDDVQSQWPCRSSDFAAKVKRLIVQGRLTAGKLGLQAGKSSANQKAS